MDMVLLDETEQQGGGEKKKGRECRRQVRKRSHFISPGVLYWPARPAERFEPFVLTTSRVWLGARPSGKSGNFAAGAKRDF
jgi:hypothetical protein